MSTTTISFKILVGGVLTNATSVVLDDPTNTFGVRRTDTGATVVAANTPLVNQSTGIYTYSFTDPEPGLTYNYFVKTLLGGIYYSDERNQDGPPANETGPNLLTLAEYRSFMGIASSDTTMNDQVNALIPAVNDQINKYLGYTVTQTSYTETLNGTGATFIRLRNLPITSIETVTFDYNTANPTVVDGSYFIYNANTAQLYFNPATPNSALPGYFAQGILNIQAAYTAGYPVADVPQQLKLAASTMVKRVINSLSNAALSDLKLDQYAEKSNVVDINRELFTDVRRILDMYKVVRFIF